MSSRTTLTISGIDLKYVVAQYTSQLAGNGACSRGASSCVGGAVAVWVTEDPHGWRADVSAPAATGGERLRLRSSSPNQTSLALSLRRPGTQSARYDHAGTGRRRRQARGRIHSGAQPLAALAWEHQAIDHHVLDE